MHRAIARFGAFDEVKLRVDANILEKLAPVGACEIGCQADALPLILHAFRFLRPDFDALLDKFVNLEWPSKRVVFSLEVDVSLSFADVRGRGLRGCGGLLRTSHFLRRLGNAWPRGTGIVRRR